MEQFLRLPRAAQLEIVGLILDVIGGILITPRLILAGAGPLVRFLQHATHEMLEAPMAAIPNSSIAAMIEREKGRQAVVVLGLIGLGCLGAGLAAEKLGVSVTLRPSQTTDALRRAVPWLLIASVVSLFLMPVVLRLIDVERRACLFALALMALSCVALPVMVLIATYFLTMYLVFGLGEVLLTALNSLLVGREKQLESLFPLGAVCWTIGSVLQIVAALLKYGIL